MAVPDVLACVPGSPGGTMRLERTMKICEMNYEMNAEMRCEMKYCEIRAEMRVCEMTVCVAWKRRHHTWKRL